MRIGIVLHDTPVYSEVFFYHKIRFLKDSGFDVRLFVDVKSKEFNLCRQIKGFSNENRELGRYYNVLIALGRLILSPCRALNLWKSNRKDGFKLKHNLLSLLNSAHILNSNLIWLHFGFATTAVYRENVANVIGAKMAVSIRGFDVCIYPLKHPNIFDLLWKRIDKLHYISDDLLEKVVGLGFDKRTPSQKITPAIDVEFFRNLDFKESKKINGKIIIVTVGRLHWKKGFDYTLEALKIFKNAGFLFEFHIIGTGVDYERLIFASHQLGLQNEVIFLGKKDRNDIKKMLACAHIYIQYSVQEGFCNSLLEAQAMGCLCVVSDAEGLRENVLDTITGFVIEKRNPSMLAEKLVEIISMNEERKTEMRKLAVQRVQMKFNLEIQKTAFKEFYHY